MRARRVVAALLASVALGVGLGACGRAGVPSGGVDGDSASTTDGVVGEVTVLAAASLTESFERIAAAFEEQYPQVSITLGFGGSSALAQQIRAGAPADVFAAASAESMSMVTDDGDAVGEPVLLARNRLEIAVPPGNPGAVTSLADLADHARTIALCATQVPCGALAEELLGYAGVVAAPDTLEVDVRAVLTKVRLGEVDAALVYRTDVRAAGPAVEGIPFPESALAANDYFVTVLTGARVPAAAEAFTGFVLSPPAREILADAGFELP